MSTIEYLKRKIKRTYKYYTGERTDGNATLADVAKLFNIKLDIKRLDDYQVTSIDYNVPSINIIDKKNSICHNGEFTHRGDAIDYSYIGGAPKFIHVKVTDMNNLVCRENLFLIAGNKLLAEQLTFLDGDYELVFKRRYPHLFEIDRMGSTVQEINYVLNTKHDNREVKQKLLSKIASNEDVDDNNLAYKYEGLYTYDLTHFIKYDDRQDKYSYMYENNAVYGVNDLTIEGVCHYLHGVCFENLNCNVRSRMPYNIDLKDYPELTNGAYISGIVFIGGTGDAIHHKLKILKNDTSILVNYNAKKWVRIERENKMPDYKERFFVNNDDKYPVMNNGRISSIEIDNIATLLEEEYENDKFIELVAIELRKFGEKIDIRRGNINEELDPLSPKVFIDKPFDEIQALVSDNKEDYFKTISEQFFDATHIEKTMQKQKIKL